MKWNGEVKHKISAVELLYEMEPVIREIKEEYSLLSNEEKSEFKKYLSDTGIPEGKALWKAILGSE